VTGRRAHSKIIRLVVVTIVALLAVACSRQDTDPTPGAAQREESPDRRNASVDTVVTWRGHAVYGHEVRAFRPCGYEQQLWVLEPSGPLWELYQEITASTEPSAEVFCAVTGTRRRAPQEGFGADYAGSLHIEHVWYVGREGPGCNDDWGLYRYRAYGTEPFWSAEISERGIRLTRLGYADLVWDRYRSEATDNGIRLIGIGGPAGVDVEILIFDRPCRGAMSGAYFGLSATVLCDDLELQGCVLRGAVIADGDDTP
jgi:uncharacterized membrane protein